MATSIKFDCHTSFNRVIPLLQITFEPAYYRELVEKRLGKRRILELDDPYWQRLPTYLISRCPLCGSRYESSADTHSLYQWLFSSEGYRSIFWEGRQNTGCVHFVGAQTFLNLNGNLPVEMDYLENGWGDIPIVTPEIFSHPMQSAAVMHSLPICRLENNQFIPKYSAYFLTYYAEDAKAMEKYTIDVLYPHAKENTDGYGGVLPPFSTSWRLNRDSTVADLGSWVEKKKLYWLDLDDPDLPLRTGAKEQFPYAGIKGYGTDWRYRKESEPWWFWKRRRWTPDGIIRNTIGKQLN